MTRIGPAGWAYKDWAGIVYPAPKTRSFHELQFLARFFDTVEINTSFYRPPTARSVTAWLEQIQSNDRFRFTAKLWRGFTHERNATASDEQAVKEGMAPLVEAGRLGALLLQFPWSFRNTAENRALLQDLRARFREYPLVLEVRHASWSDVGILDFLAELELGLCNIDQPIFKRSIKPGGMVTAAVGYVRLHGRNYRAWFTENKHVGERYDYLYSPEELDPWIDRIRAIEHQASDTYVVTNNHYLGKAVVNALEITAILRNDVVEPPPQLIERYPELEAYGRAAGSPQPRQLSLDVE